MLYDIFALSLRSWESILRSLRRRYARLNVLDLTIHTNNPACENQGQSHKGYFKESEEAGTTIPHQS